MLTQDTPAPTPEEVFRVRLHQVRSALGLSQRGLVDRLAELGYAMNQAAITRIERGDRKVSLDEAVMIAAALDVAVVNMVLPIDDADSEVSLAPNLQVKTAKARRWARGAIPLRPENFDLYLDQAPRDAAISTEGLSDEQVREFQERKLRPLRQTGFVTTEGADGWTDTRWSGMLAKEDLEGDDSK